MKDRNTVSKAAAKLGSIKTSKKAKASKENLAKADAANPKKAKPTRKEI